MSRNQDETKRTVIALLGLSICFSLAVIFVLQLLL